MDCNPQGILRVRNGSVDSQKAPDRPIGNAGSYYFILSLIIIIITQVYSHISSKKLRVSKANVEATYLIPA